MRHDERHAGARSGETARARTLSLWMAAQIIGMAGTRLINVAVPWFVLTTTRDPALAGVVAFAQMAPMVTVKALAGPMIDRVGPARVAVTCDLASCVAVAAVPLLYAADLLSWPLLLVVAAVEGTLRGPGDAAKYAMCPALANVHRLPLQRVTGLANTVDRIGSAMGAAFGGLVIAAVGAPTALVLSCATFAGAAALIGWGVGPVLARAVPAAPEPEPVGARREGYWSSLRQGWVFWRRDAVLVAVTAMIALTNLLDQAYLSVLVPEWAIDGDHGAEIVGLLFGAMTGSAIIGSAIATAIGERLPKLPTYVLGFTLAGAPRFLAIAADLPRPALVAVLVMCGVSSGFINPLVGAIIFARIPSAMVGRVSSLITALCWVLMPFGGLFGGVLIRTVGVTAALATCGVAYLVVTMAPVLVPAFRSLGNAAPEAPPTTPEEG